MSCHVLFIVVVVVFVFVFDRVHLVFFCVLLKVVIVTRHLCIGLQQLVSNLGVIKDHLEKWFLKMRIHSKKSEVNLGSQESKIYIT